jgi:hypothetical protein
MKYLRWNLVKLCAVLGTMPRVLPEGGLPLIGPEVVDAIARLMA